MFTPFGLKFHHKMLMDKNLESLTSFIANTTQQILRFMQLEQWKNEGLQLILKKIHIKKRCFWEQSRGSDRGV